MESNLAVLIDFENIAAGAEREGMGRFDVDAVFKRLKDKGRILVARSYADWGRFARFKQNLLQANVTMMELTSHGMHDKNRADIAMVVDCLELAFTKDYIDTFVLVSGDSDFTPLVLKMRELNKRVIGCGTRASTSRLLIQACDEFIFYDTLIREARQSVVAERSGAVDEEQAFAMLAETLEGLQRENPAPALASVLKTALLRRNPDFDEIELGFSTFARFLDGAEKAGYVRISRDQKSGSYRVDAADANESPDTELETEPQRQAPSEPWNDPEVPEALLPWTQWLNEQGLAPHSLAVRKEILEISEQVALERRKRRRRVTVAFVLDDVRRRLKKTRPEVPGRAIKSVFYALMEAGLLIHPDGQAVRTPAAPFSFASNGPVLLAKLRAFYLEKLASSPAGAFPADKAEALFGPEHTPTEVEPPRAELGDFSIDFDDLLLTDPDPAPAEPAPEPTPKKRATRAKKPKTAPSES